jgi:hypothetical protein
MTVRLRQYKSFDHTADIVKDASLAEQAKVAKAMAELARAFAQERPPPSQGSLRRAKTP